MKKKYDIIIVGAGLSGLLCGAYLSKQGYKICILEKHKNIGGAIQTFNRRGITFDTGMHFFGAVRRGQIQYELFKLFGFAEDLEIEEIEDFNAIVEDKKYTLPTGFHNYSKVLKKIFPNELQAIELYLSKLKEVIGNITIENIKKGFDLNSNYTEGICDFVKSITKNKDLQDVLLFNNMLYGIDAGKASVYMHSVINGSFLQSAGMFKNGTKPFLEVLKNRIENNGGEVLTSKELNKFEIKEGKVKSCLCENGERYLADKYISTLHPKISLEKTETNLIKKFYRKRISKLENTYGTFLIFIEMKENSFLFQSPNFICDKTSEKGFNTSYMLYTPYSGKIGKYANVVKIMFPMTILEVEKWKETKLYQRPDEYNDFKKNKAESIFKQIEQKYPNFKEKIKNYYTSTPLTYRDYTGIIDGSAYGVLNDYNNAIKSMISVRTKVRNLYYSGQNINFHGMLGVSITALLTSDAIINDDDFFQKNSVN